MILVLFQFARLDLYVEFRTNLKLNIVLQGSKIRQSTHLYANIKTSQPYGPPRPTTGIAWTVIYVASGFI
jgi:hypothetical protein